MMTDSGGKTSPPDAEPRATCGIAVRSQPDGPLTLDAISHLILEITTARRTDDAVQATLQAALRIANAGSAAFEIDTPGGAGVAVHPSYRAARAVDAGDTRRLTYPLNASHPTWRTARLAVVVPREYVGDPALETALENMLSVLRSRLDSDPESLYSRGDRTPASHTDALIAMQELTTAASAASDLDELCSTVHRTASRLLPMSRLQVQLALPANSNAIVFDSLLSAGELSEGGVRQTLDVTTSVQPGVNAQSALLADGEPIGMLIVEPAGGVPFTREDHEILRSISQSVAGAFERQLLLDQIARQTRHEAALRVVAERINGTMNTAELMQIASDVVFDTIECDLVLVALIERATHRVRARSTRTNLSAMTLQPIGSTMKQDSLSYDAIEHMRQVVVADIESAPHSTFTEHPWSSFRSAVATPMSIDDERVGVIVLGRMNKDGFLENELSLQQQIAGMLSTALENTTSYASHVRHSSDLGELHRLSSDIAAQLDFQKSLNEIVHAAMSLVAADGCAVGMLDGPDLVVLASVGSVAGKLPERMPAQGVILNALHSRGELIAVNDLGAAVTGVFGDLGPLPYARGLMFVPLVDPDGAAAGGIAVFSDEPRVWTERDKSLLTTLGSASARAIQNARHFEGTRNLLRASVESLAAAVEAKDPFTRNHSRNVARFSRLIAQELELDATTAGEIELAGLLHDVGKIGIPDSVLEKPGRLDSAGWAAVQLHPSIGEQILSGNPILRPLLPMVRHHHERWDGLGYPDRLRQDEIPTGSAIIAVAEAIDTITSDRPYQHARSWIDAVTEIRSTRGQQFAPYVVDAFLAANDRGVFAEDEARVAPREVSGANGSNHRSPSLDVRALRIFEEVAREIRAGADLYTFLTHVVDVLRSILEVPHVAIYVRSTSSGPVELIAAQPPIPGSPDLERRIREGLGIIAWVVRHGTLQNIPDVSRDSRYLDGGVTVEHRSELCVPLLAEGQVIGVINLESDRLDAFTASDEALMTSTADHIATAIHVVHLHEQLKNLSSTDSLTGLHNHRSFFDQLVAQTELAFSSQSPLSIAIMDVNNLKAINDSYGHLAGDAALRAVANELLRLKRDSDVVCRYGGDEYALILPGTSSAEAWPLMEHIASELGCGDFDVDGMKLPLPTASWGIATAPDDGRRPMELLRIADQRMYLQKDVTRP